MGSAAERLPTWLRVAVVVALALGLFFRFDHLGRKTFWEDEIYGTMHALGYTETQVVASATGVRTAADLQRFVGIGPEARPIPGLASTIAALVVEDPQHPPVYYLAEHLWIDAFGGNAATIRALSALFGALAIPAFALLAYELFGSPSAALIAAALLALSPFFVLYSQEAREISLWALAISLDGWLLLRTLKRPSAWGWTTYGAATAVTLYIDPIAGLTALGWLVYAFALERIRPTRKFLGCAVATLGAIVLFVPLLRTMLTSGALHRGLGGIENSRLSPLTVAAVGLRDLRTIFFDPGAFRLGRLSSTPIEALVSLVVLAVVAYAFVALVREKPFRLWGFVAIGLCLSLAPFVLSDLLGHGDYVYQLRYFVPAALGAILALAALPRSAARAPIVVALLAGGVLSCGASWRATTWWNKDFERSPQVAAIVEAAPHAVVLANGVESSRALALAYYLDPQVPVRATLRCSLCTVPAAPVPDVSVDAASPGTIFVLADRAPARAGARLRWIDPQTFPPQPAPLDLFGSIGGVGG
ncbi:MAG: glycosyltransferase family 39 protein [Vulcanimicrobiaceae bacterium]